MSVEGGDHGIEVMALVGGRLPGDSWASPQIYETIRSEDVKGMRSKKAAKNDAAKACVGSTYTVQI